MTLPPFETEAFYAEYEFTAPHLLSVSDCETLSVKALLELAGCDPAQLLNLKLGYTESQGGASLRKAIAGTYADVTLDEVLVLGAPVEGIYLAMQTLLDPGDEAIVLTPNLCDEGDYAVWRFRHDADIGQSSVTDFTGLCRGSDARSCVLGGVGGLARAVHRKG